MKKVLTYGTFDLFHYGHYFLLKRAKALGDYLIVGVSTDAMCADKGKVCILPQDIRKQIVSDLSFVDEVIFEESMNQKIEDVVKMDVDVFCLGDDYKDSFREMPEFGPVSQKCELVFLTRTPDISSSDLKEKLRAQLQTTKKY